MRTKTLIVLGLASFLALAAACGGDGDDSPSNGPSSGTGSSGGGAAEPTATSEPEAEPTSANGGGGATGGDSSSGDTVGSVTIGDDTWMIVASESCDFEPVPDTVVEVVTVAGHAESDDSILVNIDFDPRDTGLVMTVSNGGDVDWAADNASFVVTVGEPLIRGEGMFTSGGSTVAGSFEVRC